MLLVTGSSGFIGFHLAKKRLEFGEQVVGVDNHNDYYDVSLKEARLAQLNKYDNFIFEQLDIADSDAVNRLFQRYSFKRVVNLAAQAGVRYSIKNPLAYIHSNVLGFTNIIEACRHHQIEHLVYASTSSVYGANRKQPFSESDGVDHPLAIYAATKRSNELIAHSYAHLYDLPSTGLRFFTVYGPWGRPDMALFLFTKAILENKPIDVFNHGKMVRDFTYIDDIVEGVSRAVDTVATSNPSWNANSPDPASSYAPYRIYNIGNNKPVLLMDYIEALERALNKKIKLNMLPMQPGDVMSTCADTSLLEKCLSCKPKVSVDEGIKNFVNWYEQFYLA